MRAEKLKIGLIGTGGIAMGMHLPRWREIKEAEVIAVADIHYEAARNAAVTHSIPAAFGSHEELLALKPDIVDICTPNMFHTPIAIAALEAGCHVICEKPLAVSTAEVRQIGETADRLGRKLMTAQHMRYNAGSLALRRWIDTGALGEVYHARVHATRRTWLPPRASFHNPATSGGGPCYDIGVHVLDACLWMMNFAKPVRVSGVTRTNFAHGHAIPGGWGEWDRETFLVEDFASGYVVFENGASLMLETSWLGHQEENADMSFQLFGKGAGVTWPTGKFATAVNGVLQQGTLTLPKEPEAPHLAELRAFSTCVREDKASPIPWTETIKVIAILEAIYESARTGREVLLD